MLRSKKAGPAREQVRRAVHRYRPGQQPKGYHEPSESGSSGGSSDSEHEGEQEGNGQGGKEGEVDTSIREDLAVDDIKSRWARKGGAQGARGRLDEEEEKAEVSDGSADQEECARLDARSEEEEDDQPFPSVAYARPFQKSPPPFTTTTIQAGPDLSGSEEDSETSTSSGEEEEEEVPYAPPVLYKPIFVPKGSRESRAGGVTGQADLDETELERRKAMEQERRKALAQELVSQTIEREALMKKGKEDDTGYEVDDTDGLDPEDEYQQWKLRELQRLKRDREERNARKQEQAEIEARRALPEAVRLQQDLEHAKQSRQAKEGSDPISRGAFYRDDLQAIPARDRSAASEMQSFRKNLLPKSLRQRRDGGPKKTKFTPMT